MPPRWPRQPDRRDSAYRRLEDRMNFAVHVAAFGAVNSTIWFFRLIQTEAWPWTLLLTGGWAAILLSHGVYVFGVADYNVPDVPAADSDSQLKPVDATAKSLD